MKINKKTIGLIAGLICVILVVVLLLTMCNGSSPNVTETEPPQVEQTETPTEDSVPTEETADSTEPTEVATEPTEEATEPTEETEPEEENSGSNVSGSTTPGGTTGPGFGETGGSNTDSDTDTDDTEKVEISAPGAQDNPYAEVLTAIPDSFTSVLIPVGEEVCYHVHNAGGSILTIEDETAIITYNGETYKADENGIVTVELEKTEITEDTEETEETEDNTETEETEETEETAPVVFTISTSAEAETGYTLNFSEQLGGLTNPEIIESIEEITVNLEAGDEDGYYYQWTADVDGTVTFAVTGTDPAETSVDIILVNGETTVSLSENGETDENGNTVVSIDVITGDALLIQVITASEEHPAAQIVLSGAMDKAAGSEENPYTLTADVIPYVITAEEVDAGVSFYYEVYGIGGTILTIEDTDAFVIYNEVTYGANQEGIVTVQLEAANGRIPVAFQVGNGGQETESYTLTFTYPLGNMENPAELVLGENSVTVEAGDDDGYYYTWTATDAGVLTIEMDPAANWLYVINNLTTSAYGDIQYSDSDPVMSTATVEVSAGDEIQLNVNTYEPGSFATPAGSVIFTASFESSAGTADNPILIYDIAVPTEITVKAGATRYYTGYFHETTMTIENAEGMTVEFEGQTYTAENGILTVSFPAYTGMGRPMPQVFSITNSTDADAAWTLSFAYPAGHQMNPDELLIGENTAALESGDTDGYWYTWTVPEAGTLTVTMDETADWSYVVNNLTTSIYGDIQYSDSDPVVSAVTLEVSEGDEIQLNVSTYDPLNPQTIPAGSVVFTTSFEGSVGTEENPIGIYEIGTPVEVNVSAGKTRYYTGYFHETTMTIENAAGMTVEFEGQTYTAENGILTVSFPAYAGMGRPMPQVFSITNNTDADAAWTLSFAYPAGHQMNPAELLIGENTAALESGDTDGYWYAWTATEAGTLTVTMDETADWSYVVNNLTTSIYGDIQYSDSDPVVSAVTLEVSEGDEIQLNVNTYEPGSFATPAGSVVFTASFEGSVGTEENPIGIYEIGTPVEINVSAGKTRYYTGYFHETTMTIENAAGMTVEFEGQTYTAENGILTVSFPAYAGMGRPMPQVFSITNNTDADAVWTLSFAYPAGHSMNPAEPVMGENTATLESGDTDGYWYSWIAENDGTLTVAMDPGASWSYVLDNLTKYTYGDNQYSDSDSVVSTAVMEVSKGDEIQLRINTYDPQNPYNAPAGTVTFNFSFTAAVAEVTVDSTTEAVNSAAETAETTEEAEAQEVVAEEINEVIYKAEKAPASFRLTLNEGESLKNLDLTADYKLVEDGNGYFHLNSTDGPMVYVNLGEDAPYVSMYNLLGFGKTAGTEIYLEANGSKEMYTDCMSSYIKCIDSEHGVYPLTEDLIYMIQNVGTQNGWWNKNSASYLFKDIDKLNVATAWMFACCVIEAE